MRFEHPLYSLDMASANFSSLSKVQTYSQRMKFVMTEDFQRKYHRQESQLPLKERMILLLPEATEGAGAEMNMLWRSVGSELPCGPSTHCLWRGS